MPEARVRAKKDNASTIRRIVILADNDELIRRLLENVLTQMGYSTLHASDELEIAHLFHLRQHQLALFIIDISLLKAAGRALVNHLRTLQPPIPVLLTTFLDQLEVPDHYKEGFTLLQKPFTLTALRERIRALRRT